MTEGIEVEVKLAVERPAPVRELIERPVANRLAGFEAAGPIREVVVVDRYLDNEAGALLASATRVRLRQLKRHVAVTFKRRGAFLDGIASRVELEGGATADLDPARWPDSAARRELLSIVGGDRLLEIARLRQQRLVRDLQRGETRVELSLDRLEALDGEDAVATRWELEAELKAGRRDDLAELSTALQLVPGVSLAAESKLLFAMLAVQRARSGSAAEHADAARSEVSER